MGITNLALSLVLSMKAWSLNPFLSEQIAFIFQRDTMPKHGVYITANDFLNRKPRFGYTKRREGIRIRYGLMNQNNLYVNTFDSTFKLKAGDYWGYRQFNTDYRIIKGIAYEIESLSDGFYVYKHVSHSSDGSSTPYFFSRRIDSNILPLTRKNLRKTYKDDKVFIQKLELVKWPMSLFKEVPPEDKLRIVALYELSHHHQIGSTGK